MANDQWNVRALPVVGPALAAQIKRKIGMDALMTPAAMAPKAALSPLKPTKPGKERWPVKTGVDADAPKVKPQIVPATVEELGRFNRPAGMKDVTKLSPAFQAKRAAPTETTIWQIECEIVAIKLEDDGDYHLVLQGVSGEFVIGEIPTPDPPFVGTTSPFLDNIRQARIAIEKKFFKTLKAAKFVAMGKYQVPLASFTTLPKGAKSRAFAPLAPSSPSATTFKSKVKPSKARITGVGFFDRVHGQTGVAANGIELHPVLEVKFL